MKVEIQNGVFAYPHSERTVLKQINFSLSDGDILAVLGPNGAGKTTLLRCITGLLHWKEGVTLLDGRPLLSIPPKTRWQYLSSEPQAGGVRPAYTVEEMVMLGRAPTIGTFSVPKKTDEEAVKRCLEKTGLTAIAHRSCSSLSGGEFQMVLIARALVCEPRVLILDEPESNLDFQNQLLVMDTISRLAAEGITCLFNTHYPAHALRWATKALMLAKDGAYSFGNVDDVVTEDHLLRYFGVRTVIGRLETENESFADIIPISAVSPTPTLSADRLPDTLLEETNDTQP